MLYNKINSSEIFKNIEKSKIGTNEKVWWMCLIEIVELVGGETIEYFYKKQFTKQFMLKKSGGQMKKVMIKWFCKTYTIQQIQTYNTDFFSNMIFEDIQYDFASIINQVETNYIQILSDKEFNKHINLLCLDILKICFEEMLYSSCDSLQIEVDYEKGIFDFANILRQYVIKKIEPPIFDERDALYKKTVIEERDKYIQHKQREYWINVYGKCMICDKNKSSLLWLSHIKDCSKCSAEERKNQYNTLLLCRDHDGVFSEGDIAIMDDGTLICAELDDLNKKLLWLDRYKKCYIHKEMIPFLKWHRENKYKGKL